METETKKKITFGSVVRVLFNIIIYAVIAAMVLAAAALMISKAQGKTLFVGGKSVMWIITGSMDDEVNHTIPAQSYVLMEKVTDPNTLQVGDVICFHSDDPDLASMSTDLVVHRIVEVIAPEDSSTGTVQFRTKGDANYVQDRYLVDGDSVVAVWVENLPLLTFFGRLLASVYGIVLLAIIIVAAIFTVYIPEFKRRAAEDAAEEAAAEEAEKQAEMQRLIAAEVEKLRAQQEQGKQPEPKEQPKQ